MKRGGVYLIVVAGLLVLAAGLKPLNTYTVNYIPLLKDIPKGKWISLPIPLNCFKSENFDISKIASPLVISTAGKFTLSLANVHLEKRAAEDVGCQ